MSSLPVTVILASAQKQNSNGQKVQNETEDDSIGRQSTRSVEDCNREKSLVLHSGPGDFIIAGSVLEMLAAISHQKNRTILPGGRQGFLSRKYKRFSHLDN